MIELLLVAERFLADGALDRAEHVFVTVADGDPRNAIAVVGLARVARARGNPARALEEARRALDIDPDEAAAHRLVAELEAAARPVVALDVPPDGVGTVASPEPGSRPEPAPRRSFLDRVLALLGRRG